MRKLVYWKVIWRSTPFPVLHDGGNGFKFERLKFLNSIIQLENSFYKFFAVKRDVFVLEGKVSVAESKVFTVKTKVSIVKRKFLRQKVKFL